MNRIKTVNQYFIYGLLVQLNTQEKWNLSGNEDISCLFNTRDGESVIIGRILKQSTNNNPLLGLDKPIAINDLKLPEVDELIIQASVEKNFDVTGDFHYYFVTHTR